LLTANLPAAGARDLLSMPSATSSARPLFANPTNPQTALAAAGWTAVTAPLPPIQNIAAIAASTYHTCALTTAGGVLCWGLNEYGQLGDGTTTDRSTPVGVAGLGSEVAALAADGYYTCALTTAGGVKCWGSNWSGQLGDGTTTDRLTPVDVAGLGSGAVAIASGGGHTCALLTAGRVKCWGSDHSGQLGLGTVVYSTTPVDVVTLLKLYLPVVLRR
jgi:alpha-tubulin suppressor-like RCC1 family protein